MRKGARRSRRSAPQEHRRTRQSRRYSLDLRGSVGNDPSMFAKLRVDRGVGTTDPTQPPPAVEWLNHEPTCGYCSDGHCRANLVVDFPKEPRSSRATSLPCSTKRCAPIGNADVGHALWWLDTVVPTAKAEGREAGHLLAASATTIPSMRRFGGRTIWHWEQRWPCLIRGRILHHKRSSNSHTRVAHSPSYVGSSVGTACEAITQALVRR